MSGSVYSELFEPHEEKGDIFLDLGDHTITYGAFLDMVAAQAGALLEAGVAPGDRVAVQAPKTPEMFALYGAAAKCGAALLPLNTSYTPTELDFFIGDATPKVVVCDPSGAAALEGIAAKAGATLFTLGADGAGTLSDAAAKADPLRTPVPRAPDDLAAILYTSGTTGRSKGAMLTNRNLLSNAHALVDLWRFTKDDVLIHALPIFHTHGLFVAGNIALLTGMRLRFMEKFDLDVVIDALPSATSMMGVPTFYTRLLSDPRLTRERCANMRLFISGSAPLLAETHRSFEERTGHRILERYGMTETNMNTSNPYDGDRRAGTVGPAIPGIEVRVCEPGTDRALPQGETGMVEVRGPNVFKGYWNMPEKTKEELREDGFFITGDLGRIDEDGYLSIVGRQKDLIISGGFNIYPKEIETVIDALPGVVESAVIGVPHVDMGEGVVAVIVGDVEVPAIEAALKLDLAGFKRPRHFAVVDALPRNTMGKVQKNVLREEYASVFAR